MSQVTCLEEKSIDVRTVSQLYLAQHCLKEPINPMRSIQLLLPYVVIPLPLVFGKPLTSRLGMSLLLGLRRSLLLCCRGGNSAKGGKYLSTAGKHSLEFRTQGSPFMEAFLHIFISIHPSSHCFPNNVLRFQQAFCESRSSACTCLQPLQGKTVLVSAAATEVNLPPDISESCIHNDVYQLSVQSFSSVTLTK